MFILGNATFLSLREAALHLKLGLVGSQLLFEEFQSELVLQLQLHQGLSRVQRRYVFQFLYVVPQLGQHVFGGGGYLDAFRG